jgi:hypothetical protein
MRKVALSVTSVLLVKRRGDLRRSALLGVKASIMPWPVCHMELAEALQLERDTLHDLVMFLSACAEERSTT